MSQDGVSQVQPHGSASVVLSPQLLGEAAEWAIVLQYESPDPARLEDFRRWRSRSALHEAAWERAQSVTRAFTVGDDAGKAAITRLQAGRDRRRSLAWTAAILLLPVGWQLVRSGAWHEWTADERTASGEQRHLTLPDGSRLTLNTGSAVNIAFDASARRVRLLSGEVMVTTAEDSAPGARPFLVETPQATLRALGTRFAVRTLDGEQTRVTVFEGAVEARPVAGPPARIPAGEQASVDAARVFGQGPAARMADLWEQGMLLARDMRLADLVTELARYRPGVLRCDPAVADLAVSGAISLTDTDGALDLLAREWPVQVHRRTRYWVTVGPASRAGRDR